MKTIRNCDINIFTREKKWFYFLYESGESNGPFNSEEEAYDKATKRLGECYASKENN